MSGETPSREVMGAEQDEVLFPDLKLNPPIVITATEKKRYKANEAFSEAVFDDFLMFINKEGDTGHYDEIYDKAEQISESLSASQKVVFGQVLGEIKYMRQEADQVSPATYRDEFRRISRVLNIPEDKISDDDMEVTPLGALVVYVDGDVKKKVLGDNADGCVHDRDDRFRMSMALDKAGLGNTGETERVLNRAFGTIFVGRNPNDLEKTAQVRRHELFHHLYLRALAPFTEVQYPTNCEREFFSQFKNELIAYLLGDKWRNDEAAFLDTQTSKKLKTSGKDLFEYLGDDIKNELRPEEGQNTGQGQDGQSSESELNQFWLQYLVTIRELSRLKYLHHNDFSEAIKQVLTTQDFKELAYKLSSLDTGRPVDAMAMVAGMDNMENLLEPDVARVVNAIYSIVKYSVSCANLDVLISKLKDAVSKGTDSGFNAKALGWFKDVIAYYEEPQSKDKPA